MNIFYLVRHAHAEWTPDEQRPISEKGQVDAHRLADLLYDLPIDGIYSSSSLRAQQTVTPPANRLGLSVLIEHDLRERELGDAPGVNDFFATIKKTWQDPAFSYPGGETNAAAQLRGVAVVQRLREQFPGGHLVLSTHGNLLSLVLQHYDPSVDYLFWKALTMPDIYVLNLSPNDDPAICRLRQEYRF